MPEAVPKEQTKVEENVAVEKVAPTAVAENGSSGESNGQGEGQAVAVATKDTNVAVVDSTDDAAAQPVPPKEMRTVVLSAFGNLKNIKVTKKPEPVLKSGEVLIRVKLCGLGFQDLHVRQGSIDGVPKCPFTMGFECAGVVEEIASESENESNGNGNGGGDNNDVTENLIKVGDRVVAFSEYNAWAELVAVPAKHVYVIPTEMAYSDAVALVMNYVIAHMLVFDMANISGGKSVLVHSASGGVGMAIAQLCATVSNVSVIGICSKPKLDLLKDNVYFSHVLERNSEYPAEVKKIFPDGVDVIFDCMGGDECNKGYALLKPMGRCLLYGSSNIMNGETKSLFSITKSWWQAVKISPMKLVDDNKSLAGLNFKKLLFKFNKSDYVRSTVEKVFNLWQGKKLKPIIDSTWALEDVQEAMQKMHSHNNVGKIVLDPNMEPKPKQPTPVKSKDKKKQHSTEDKKQSEPTTSVTTTTATTEAVTAASVSTTTTAETANANDEAVSAPDTAPVTNGASA